MQKSLSQHKVKSLQRSEQHLNQHRTAPACSCNPALGLQLQSCSWVTALGLQNASVLKSLPRTNRSKSAGHSSKAFHVVLTFRGAMGGVRMGVRKNFSKRVVGQWGERGYHPWRGSRIMGMWQLGTWTAGMVGWVGDLRGLFQPE